MFRRFNFVKVVIQWGCVGHCVFEYLGDFVKCSGPSMEPTLRTNDILVTERISKQIQQFDRGDIIIARCPTEPKNFICKRIVGLPGDKIQIKPRFTWNPFGSSKSIITTDSDGKESTVAVDDVMALLDQTDEMIDDNDNPSTQINNQTSSQRTFRTREILIPRGHVWIEGDNSGNSLDSRNYGPVPMGLIQSRAMARIWPLNDITSF